MCEMAEIVWKIAELLQSTVQLTSTIFPVSMTKNTAHMDEIRYQHVKRKKGRYSTRIQAPMSI